MTTSRSRFELAVALAITLLQATWSPDAAVSTPPAPPATVRWTSFKAGEIDLAHPPPVRQSVAIPDYIANRLIFRQTQVDLWIEANVPRRRNTFSICGLPNPEIVLPVHSRLTVTLLNFEHFSAPVRFAILPSGPPYPALLLINQSPAFQRLYRLQNGRLAPVVAPRGPGVIYTATFTFEFDQPGTLWYVNPIPGAANMGFYGKLTVLPSMSR